MRLKTWANSSLLPRYKIPLLTVVTSNLCSLSVEEPRVVVDVVYNNPPITTIHSHSILGIVLTISKIAQRSMICYFKFSES